MIDIYLRIHVWVYVYIYILKHTSTYYISIDRILYSHRQICASLSLPGTSRTTSRQRPSPESRPDPAPGAWISQRVLRGWPWGIPMVVDGPMIIPMIIYDYLGSIIIDDYYWFFFFDRKMDGHIWFFSWLLGLALFSEQTVANRFPARFGKGNINTQLRQVQEPLFSVHSPQPTAVTPLQWL